MQGGGVPGWSPGDRALQEPAGGLALLVACLTLPFGNPPGRLALLVACRHCLSLTFLPPIPPAPFPGGEGGDQKFISPGASPPAPLH